MTCAGIPMLGPSVIFCPEIGRHAEVAEELAARRIHMVTEKPMAGTLHDALRMARAAREAGVGHYVALSIVGVDGSNVRPLTQEGMGTNMQPTVSPDGGTIAFTSIRLDGNPDIWLMAKDGTQQRPFTKSPQWKETSPRFLRDGDDVRITDVEGARMFRNVLLVSILAAPAVMSVLLGGFAASSGVILWSLLAPFAAIAFSLPGQARAWFAAYLGILVAATALTGDRTDKAHAATRAK